MQALLYTQPYKLDFPTEVKMTESVLNQTDFTTVLITLRLYAADHFNLTTRKLTGKSGLRENLLLVICTMKVRDRSLMKGRANVSLDQKEPVVPLG